MLLLALVKVLTDRLRCSSVLLVPLVIGGDGFDGTFMNSFRLNVTPMFFEFLIGHRCYGNAFLFLKPELNPLSQFRIPIESSSSAMRINWTCHSLLILPFAAFCRFAPPRSNQVDQTLQGFPPNSSRVL